MMISYLDSRQCRIVSTSGVSQMSRTSFVVVVLLVLLGFAPPLLVGQTPVKKAEAPKAEVSKPKVAETDAERESRAIQQDALTVLKQLAIDIRREFDKPRVARLEAQIADTLWGFDEPAARLTFREAFEIARQPLPEPSLTSKNPKGELIQSARRQASAIRDVLAKLSIHDKRAAEDWLKQLNEANAKEAKESNSSKSNSSARAEMLIQLAAQLALTDPEQAFRLATMSLAGDAMPSDNSIGNLLFALKRSDKSLSDQFFREALITLRRRGFDPSFVPVSLKSYVTDFSGHAFSDAARSDVLMLAAYLFDAAANLARAWQAAPAGEGIGESDHTFFNFLMISGVQVVAVNAPDQLELMRTHLAALSLALSAQQRQGTDRLLSISRDDSPILDTQFSSIETRLERAENERNSRDRDTLFRSVALELMRSDIDRALSVASKIDDADLRAQTEDDVYLTSLKARFKQPSFEATKATILKLHDLGLRARMLAELGSKAFKAKDKDRASDLLYEAFSVASKMGITADKLGTLLDIAEQTAAVDSVRGFETLSAAVTVTNSLDFAATPVTEPPRSQGVRIEVITVVNGKERSAGRPPTLDSMDFNQVSAFGKLDYFRTRGLADNLQDKLLRAQFLVSLARSIITATPASQSDSR